MREKFVVFMTCLLLCVFLAASALVVGCTSGVEREALPRVAILQDKAQEWADAMKLGFYDGLSEGGMEPGTDLIVIVKSAAGDPTAMTALSESVAVGDYDVVFTLGTQASQIYFGVMKGGAMVFGSVTDPVKAGFYDGDLSQPLKNLTGTQDLWPYEAQFDLMRELLPNATTVGTVYNSGEVNSQVSLNFVKAEARRKQFAIVERTVTSQQEVDIAVASLLAEGVDALYIPADNTAQNASLVIIEAAMQKKVPVFTGISGIVENGALGTVGTNYYQVGKVNARQVIEILSGRPAAKVPVGVANKGDIYLNLVSARELGIRIPEEIRRRAFRIYE